MKGAIALLFLLSIHANAEQSRYEWVLGEIKTLIDYRAYSNKPQEILITLENLQWEQGESGPGATQCGKNFRIKAGALGVTSAVKAKIYSTMLSAQMASKKVSLYVDNTSNSDCLVQVGKAGSNV